MVLLNSAGRQLCCKFLSIASAAVNNTLENFEEQVCSVFNPVNPGLRLQEQIAQKIFLAAGERTKRELGGERCQEPFAGTAVCINGCKEVRIRTMVPSANTTRLSKRVAGVYSKSHVLICRWSEALDH